MKVTSRNIFLLTLLALVSVTIFTACDIDGEESYSFRPAGTLGISGESEVESGTKGEEYYVLNYTVAKTYTWTVSGPAEIAGENTGEAIELNFMGPANEADTIVTLTVTNSENFSGTKRIVVNQAIPTATYSLERATPVRNGGKDTLVAVFSKPLQTVPTFSLIPSDGVSGGSLGTVTQVTAADTAKLKVKDLTKAYYVVFTGGSGNGTQEIVVSGAVATAEFGGQAFVDDTVSILKVDNTPPTGYFTFSSPSVRAGDSVTVTAQFSEPVTDVESIMINIVGSTTVAQLDTMEATDDPAVWTYTYHAEGAGTEILTITLDGVADLAGNDLETTMGNHQGLMIDNTAPLISGASAIDKGDFALMSITSNESGMVHVVVLPDGSPAPTSANDFIENEEAEFSGMSTVATGGAASFTGSLKSGAFDVYFISSDVAGNWSLIQKFDLVMD